MNIGIIVHSETGNTNSVALKLKEKLSLTGHSVELVQLSVVGPYKPGAKDIKLEKIPDIKRYDGVVFAAPVWGFALSAVMKTYLTQLAPLPNKKVACFVTQLFPYAWMGGKQAIGQMQQICKSKGVEICGTGVVNWKSSHREEKITEVVERLSSLF